MEFPTLPEQGANALVNHMIAKIQQLEEFPAEGDISLWLDTMLGVLRLSVRIEQSCILIKYYVLSIIKRHWDSLPFDFRARYDFQFDVFAAREAGELSRSTLDNYMRAATTFLEDLPRPFPKVSVPLRDERGNPVIDTKTGAPVCQIVEFDPTKVPITKLVLATPLARKGTLQRDPNLLSLLADDGVTADELRYSLYARPIPQNDLNIIFTVEGPMLVAHRGGESVEIAEIDFHAYNTNDLAHDAIERMLSALSAKFDEERWNKGYLGSQSR